MGTESAHPKVPWKLDKRDYRFLRSMRIGSMECPKCNTGALRTLIFVSTVGKVAIYYCRDCEIEFPHPPEPEEN